MKRLTITVFIAFLSACLCLPVKAQDVVVGTLFDHSGALKDWGPRHQNAADLVAKQMTRAGWTMQLVHRDSQTAAEPAKQAAKTLIETDKVAAIIGSASSGVIVPVAESVTCPAEILMISPGATAPYITTLAQDKDRDVLFRTAPSDKLQGVVLGTLAAGMYSTASIMYVNNPYGLGLARQFQTSFERRGGLATMVPHGEEVSESYVDELRNAFARKYGTKPLLGGHLDVLGVFSYPEHAKIYVKEALEVFECKNFIFSDGAKSEELAAVVGPEKLEGMMGTSPGIAIGKSYAMFKTAYTDTYGELPRSPFIANAYDAAAVIGLAAYAAKAKGTPLTSVAIKNQLRNVAKPPGTFIGPGEFKKAFTLLDSGADINYEGASGTVDFDENGDVVTPIEIWKYNADGKIVTFRVETQIPEE